jgi:ribonuclease BN (tRNA processing enzyme)
MNKIKFLGTAGARFVVTRQLRRSGGIYLNLDDTNVLIDPGPGSLIRCLSSKPIINPLNLDGIILTHRHIDHSNDVNIMIEAMSNGGIRKRGAVFAPDDAFNNDPVILKYVRNYVDKIGILKERGSYNIGNISFSTPVKHIHGVETYGLDMVGKNCSISIISDTKYFKNLGNHYGGNLLVLNIVLLEEREEIDHLSLNDVEKIINETSPKMVVLTHFGMSLIKSRPWEIAEKLTKRLGIDVIAAYDGMEIKLDDLY